MRHIWLDACGYTPVRGAGKQTAIYNVDRVLRLEGQDALPADCSKLPPKVPELRPPLPSDLSLAIIKSQQPVTAAYSAPGHDSNDARRKEADAAAALMVFFRSGSQKAAPKSLGVTARRTASIRSARRRLSAI